MKLKEDQYRKIAKLLPKQRGNVKIDNRDMLNALIYRCKNGCSWRDLPREFGNWHVIYVRFARWTKKGLLEKIQAVLSEEELPIVSNHALDSTSAKVHPDAFGCQKKRQTGDRKVSRRVEH